MMSRVDRYIKEDFYKTLRKFKIMEEPDYVDFTAAAGIMTHDLIEEMNKTIYGQFGRTDTLAVSPDFFKGIMAQIDDKDES